MSSKLKITGSEFADENLANDVCSHLSPILDYLAESGLTYNAKEPLFTDKGGAKTRFVNGKIDFSELQSKFDIPDFIELLPKYKSVVCRRCWCDISAKK